MITPQLIPKTTTFIFIILLKIFFSYKYLLFSIAFEWQWMTAWCVGTPMAWQATSNALITSYDGLLMLRFALFYSIAIISCSGNATCLDLRSSHTSSFSSFTPRRPCTKFWKLKVFANYCLLQETALLSTHYFTAKCFMSIFYRIYT